MRRIIQILLSVAIAATLLTPPAATAADGVVHCVGTVELAVACATTSATIQGGVDAAQPGDAVLIGEGTYNEAVDVTTDDLIIRGVNRNTVILEGDAETQEFGIKVTGANVEVSNLTVHHYTNTGVFWVGTSGYTGRYLTAYNNRRYGLYALGTHTGIFETSYASGNADSGFYIGECRQCYAVIRDVDAVNNALGYSGTNASGHLIIEDSRWIDNGAGILPNTLDSEKHPPQCCIEIRNNIVAGSGNTQAPAEGIAGAALGIGIGVSGGSFNDIHDNVIENCAVGTTDCENRYAISIFPFPETTPNVYTAHGNRVERNTIVGSSGVADLSLAAPAGEFNCFSDNTFATSDPPLIEDLYPCRIEDSLLRNSPIGGSPLSSAELALGLARFGETRGDWKTAPAPPAQATMADPLEGLPV